MKGVRFTFVLEKSGFTSLRVWKRVSTEVTTWRQ